MGQEESYIVLLRGINVGGQKKIKMADLRALFESLGFKEVQSYIQSGNVLFKYRKMKEKTLEKKIAETIENRYGFEVPVKALTCGDLKKSIKKNPFGKNKLDRVYLAFLSTKPDSGRLQSLKATDFDPEEFHYDNQVVYFFSPEGYKKNKLNNNFLEKKLAVSATTRNWRTVTTILEMFDSK